MKLVCIFKAEMISEPERGGTRNRKFQKSGGTLERGPQGKIMDGTRHAWWRNAVPFGSVGSTGSVGSARSVGSAGSV